MINHKKLYRVMASFYPTPHNKIWLSSGCVALYTYFKEKRYLNFSIFGILK